MTGLRKEGLYHSIVILVLLEQLVVSHRVALLSKKKELRIKKLSTNVNACLNLIIIKYC